MQPDKIHRLQTGHFSLANMADSYQIPPSLQEKKIAIVGAGPSGAIALDSFLKRGFKNVTVFEKRSAPGGTWNLDEHIGIKAELKNLPIGKIREEAHPPTVVPAGADSATPEAPFVAEHDPELTRYNEGSLYPSVETNILASFMAFTNKPFKDQIAPCREKYGNHHDFRTHDVIREYILDYFHRREEFLKLNTTVERAFQVKGPGSQWRLTLREHVYGERQERWWTEDFDFLYCASGRFSVPRIPNVPGLKEALKSLPKDTVIHTKTYRDPKVFKDKSVLLVGASWSNADVAHAIADIAQSPVHLALNTVMERAVPAFKQPFIEAHGGISKVSLNTNKQSLDVTFTTGETIIGIEKIVFGTGYHIAYPYLNGYVNQYGGLWHGERHTQNLYWSTWWKYDCSLVISSIITDGITWRALEAQAKSTSYLWGGYPRAQGYTLKEAEKWESDRRNLNLRDFHLWWPRYPEFIAGITKVGTGQDKFPDGLAIDTSDYNELFAQSLALKGEQWSVESKRRLVQDPTGYQRYERTGKILENRKISS